MNQPSWANREISRKLFGGRSATRGGVGNEENRHDEAFAYIEHALQYWPDLQIAAQLHDRFSKDAGLPVRARRDQRPPAQSKSPLRWLSRVMSRAISGTTRQP
jgi:hypothetical protein